VDDRVLRIGTRRSRLAVAQAQEVAYSLALLGEKAHLVPMTTSGDRGLTADGPGGVKGMFVAEIVRALQREEVDLAVHSAKDLPSQDPQGVVIGAVPERAAPFDVLISREEAVSDGAVIGTSSIRRQAQLRRSRPELRVQDLRGNVDTRLAKLEAGEVDGLLLAAAGLARLGITPEHSTPLPLEEMVPAPGQGALAIQVRDDGGEAAEIVGRLDHPRSRAAFEAERALVAELGGDCSLPLGAYAEQRENGVRLLAVVIRPDGSDLLWAQAEAADSRRVAFEVCRTLVEGGAREILAEVSTRFGGADD
jgi:hydroxymethylbilane synthase